LFSLSATIYYIGITQDNNNNSINHNSFNNYLIIFLFYTMYFNHYIIINIYFIILPLYVKILILAYNKFCFESDKSLCALFRFCKENLIH